MKKHEILIKEKYVNNEASKHTGSCLTDLHPKWLTEVIWAGMNSEMCRDFTKTESHAVCLIFHQRHFVVMQGHLDQITGKILHRTALLIGSKSALLRLITESKRKMVHLLWISQSRLVRGEETLRVHSSWLLLGLWCFISSKREWVNSRAKLKCVKEKSTVCVL